jgi:hypothetical protein
VRRADEQVRAQASRGWPSHTARQEMSVVAGSQSRQQACKGCTWDQPGAAAEGRLL